MGLKSHIKNLKYKGVCNRMNLQHNIKPEYVTEYLKTELLGLIESIEGEYILELHDVDDLHDCTIESIETDRLYYALNSILPVVFDDCANFVDSEQDYYNPYQHCDADFYGC